MWPGTTFSTYLSTVASYKKLYKVRKAAAVLKTFPKIALGGKNFFKTRQKKFPSVFGGH
jgi:hypothetical protein